MKDGIKKMRNGNAVRRVEAGDAEGLTTTRPEVEDSYRNFRRVYDDPQKKWQIEVQQRICEFAKLPDRWDGSTALAVKWDAGMFALNVLGQVMQPRTPVPQVVPTPGGGVQLEWHEGDIDLELHVTAPYECELWFEDHRTGICLSGDLTQDFSDLQTAVNLLTRR